MTLEVPKKARLLYERHGWALDFLDLEYFHPIREALAESKATPKDLAAALLSVKTHWRDPALPTGPGETHIPPMYPLDQRPPARAVAEAVKSAALRRRCMEKHGLASDDPVSRLAKNAYHPSVRALARKIRDESF